jgi:hypothetical protein
MNYKKFIKAINNRFLRGKQPTKRVAQQVNKSG